MLSRLIRLQTIPLQKRFFTENLKNKINSLNLTKYYLYSCFVVGSGYTVYHYNITFQQHSQKEPFSTALMSLAFGLLRGFVWPTTLLVQGCQQLDKMYQHLIKDTTKEN